MKKMLLMVTGLLLCQLMGISQTLLHYWNFNNSASEAALLTPNISLVAGGGIAHVAGGTSLIDFASGTGQNFDLLNENARSGDAAGTHLRFNNPIGGSLVFALPTAGATGVVVKYVTRRSGSGAGTQVVEYTTDGTNYTALKEITVTETPTLETLDFSAITAVNNNANFKIKISFSAGAGGAVGNNRFDNFTVDANLGVDNLAPTVVFSPINNATMVATNVQPTITFNKDARLVNNTPLDNSNVDALVELRLNNAAGTTVAFDATVANRVITISPSAALQNGQQYYVALKANVVEGANDVAIIEAQSSAFTSITTQTVFAAGDWLPVAYRMNATETDDEVGFLTLVDILPGTLVNLTDAKYTDNAQPQCPNGIVWTAPAAGVAAGTVITIKTDGLTANIGTVAGSGFGLSSGGDQVIVYTGSAAAPSYITAFSSNAWVAASTVCNGSLSKLPAGLEDGISSINLSIAPGNVAGNTVNAYYNGTQAGTTAQLKAAILNPANWMGVGGSTPPQTWPEYDFSGKPAVVSAKVLNQTSIQVIFNRDLDAASATDIANFTGVAGLSSVVRTNNGALPDTLTLVYGTAFAQGGSYTLTINNVKDAGGHAMASPFVFNFSYNTTIAFADKFLSVSEAAGFVSIKLKLENPATGSVDVVLKAAPWSNTDASDITYASTTLNFTGSSNAEQTITIPVNNDAVEEMDEYFVLSLENIKGLALSGKQYLTVYIKDDDRKAPVATEEIKLKYVSGFKPNTVSGSTTEIVVHDAATQRLFMTSAIQDRLDIASFANPAAITLIKSVDMKPYGGITSVAVKNGVVAVASPNANEQLDGSVVFFNTNGDFIKQVTVGALPDMITFTPDGNKILTANEGQPSVDYSVDPEGSVSIIDISGGIASVNQSKVTTVYFTQFNAVEAQLIAAGVRKTKSTSTLSQDLEPEYITISADSKKAWVSLQENNAIAEIDLTTNQLSNGWPLGKKDFNVFGNGFDASDNSGVVHISNYPVKSFYMPDGLANYTANGKTYIVSANEGDEKEYGNFVERVAVNNASVVLDPVKFPNAAVLKEDHNLGRLRISNLSGDTDGDGDYDELVMVGARSFSIWDAESRTQVYDSKDDFEMFTYHHPVFSAYFNADNEGGNVFKSRSRAKGPEPEGVTVASINGQVYAFVGLERIGGIMVYNVTDPANVKLVDYKNNRSANLATSDLGPEGIIYISPNQSPDGKAYITIANELSGNISVYEIEGDGTLPISLISYQAKLQATGDVLLSWATSTEHDNDYFTIERSVDGVNFVELDKVKSLGDANNTQHYSYTDNNPAAGKNYYRLSQTDKNGGQKFAGIKIVDISQAVNSWAIVPNPLVGNTINVSLKGYQLGSAVTVKLFDIAGKLVYTGKTTVNAGKLQITLPHHPAAGVYKLHINGMGTKTLVVKD
jgi:hypothetical protein